MIPGTEGKNRKQGQLEPNILRISPPRRYAEWKQALLLQVKFVGE
jgi:hypothetical protein